MSVQQQDMQGPAGDPGGASPGPSAPAGGSSTGQRPSAAKRRGCLPWVLIVVVILAGLLFIPAGPEQEVDLNEEFILHPIIELPAIGPIDLSINKAVIYLWITVGILVAVAIVISRTLRARPGRFQVVMEGLYDLARDGITGSVMKKGADRWFPYIGGVFFFVLVANLVGLIPLPFGENNQLAFYAATGNLSVTIVLAAFTFIFTQYAGIKAHGLFRYMRSWAPAGAPPVLKQFIWGIHLISEVFRLVSLSVRLFANMLAGHAILAVFFAMALIFQNYAIAVLLQGGSVAIYMFEIFIAVIQAFIFAVLSAVYIGGALEEGH